MSNLTAKLKAELWDRFGTKKYPAEWDGNVHGGGKVSQRFWEYLKTIEMLELTEDSVVLDIGGGSPKTGVGFFSMILAKYVKQVVILDSCICDDPPKHDNVFYIKKNASYDQLEQVFKDYGNLTHISCISVFEHIEFDQQVEIIAGINDFYCGETFVTTVEYHSKNRFFGYQVTTKSATKLFSPLSSFYLDRYEASPVLCENAFDEDRLLKQHTRGKLIKHIPFIGRGYIPRWYPLAFRFLRKP